MALQFTIQLEGVKNPTVWRTIVMPDKANFHDLHDAIQAIFGWEDAHLFNFVDNRSKPSVSISDPSPYDERPVIDSHKTLLSKYFKVKGDQMIYTYDFGDNWEHSVKFEGITNDRITNSTCIAGEGACPPEDCGGAWGYENFKQIMSQPNHPEYENMKEWLGYEEDDEWDPNFSYK